MASVEGTWTIDEATLVRGKKLGLELLFSIRETVPKDLQNEALGAAVAFLLGQHYSTILTYGGSKEADGWLSAVLEKAQGVAAQEGKIKVSFAFARKD